VPVRACPIMSVPASAMGIASAWMGKGYSMPFSERASTISGTTPSSAKVVWCSIVSAFSVSVMPVFICTSCAERTAGGNNMGRSGRAAR